MFSSADDEGQVSEPLNGAHLRSIFSLKAGKARARTARSVLLKNVWIAGNLDFRYDNMSYLWVAPKNNCSCTRMTNCSIFDRIAAAAGPDPLTARGIFFASGELNEQSGNWMTIVCSRITPLANSCLEQRHFNLDFLNDFFLRKIIWRAKSLKVEKIKKKFKFTKKLTTLAL